MSFPGLDFYNKSMVFVGEVFEDDPRLSLHTGVLSEAHQSPNRQHLYEKKNIKFSTVLTQLIVKSNYYKMSKCSSIRLIRCINQII